MRNRTFVVYGLAVSVCLFLFSTPANKLAQAGVEEGKKVYETKCMLCHGEKGEGDGEAAYLLYPKPRNFTQGWFKIRSTPSGSLPTDDDLLKVISNGMPGSSMPAWGGTLSETQRKDVIAYIKTLSEIFSIKKPEAPVKVGEEPLITIGIVEKGKQLYEKKECWKCHGHGGKGDGPSAGELVDDWGVPVKVADFTRGIYKGGASDRDIYLRFTTGLTGTPMPSFATELSDEDRWAVVRFVKSLTQGGVDRWIEDLKEHKTIVSKYVSGPLPLDTNSSTWDTAPQTAIPLTLLWQRSEMTQYVKVRSINNGTEVALLLSWNDPSKDTGVLQTEGFRDAAAVQFSLSPNLPFYGMGEKEGAANMWHWKADWEEDLVQFASIESQYSAMHDDFARDTYNLGIRNNLYRSASFVAGGLSAGNLLSLPNRGSSVEDLNAVGFGTLTAQPPEEQNVSGKGVWKNGEWRVVYKRILGSNGSNDAKITAGKPVPIAFAVWDGGQGDRDGQKSVSQWHELVVEYGE